MLNSTRVSIASYLWSIGGQTHKMTALLTFLLLHGWKQIDSMSLCICSAVAHRWLQNVVGTSVTNSPYDSCATFLFLPHFDVICDLLLNKRTAQRKLCANYFIADFSKASLQTHYDVTSLDNKLRLLNSTWWSEQFEIPSKRSHLVFFFFKSRREMYLPCPSFRPFGDCDKRLLEHMRALHMKNLHKREEPLSLTNVFLQFKSDLLLYVIVIEIFQFSHFLSAILWLLYPFEDTLLLQWAREREWTSLDWMLLTWQAGKNIN